MKPVLFKICLALYILLIIIVSCKQTGKNKKHVSVGTEQLTNGLFDTSKWVIFSATTFKFDNSKPASLNETELVQVNNLLSRYLSVDSKESSAIYELNKYYMQLVPGLNNKNEKEIWINCVCDVQGMDWKKAIIMAKDGGRCYFNCMINLSTKKIYDFKANGGP